MIKSNSIMLEFLEAYYNSCIGEPGQPIEDKIDIEYKVYKNDLLNDLFGKYQYKWEK